MVDVNKYDRKTLVAASRIMVVAGFDPQTGAGDAFNYVAGQIDGLPRSVDIGEVSKRISDHLSQEYRIQLRQPVDSGKVYDVLRAEL